MRVTNIHGVPETIERAMIKQQAQYDAGEVDSSVTSLIQPARISLLRKINLKEIVRDITEEFWALLGSGVHHLLELGATPNMIVEERLFMDIDGWRISGAIDVQEVHMNEVDIIDYKVTSTYSITMDEEPKMDWVAQLNLQALLIEANKPMRVRKMHICAILRDWSASEIGRRQNYPISPIVMVPIPIWTKDEQLEYARSRIASHRRARFDHAMGNEIEYCTNEDRWMRNEKWAVIKKGGKRAFKVFDNPAEAAELVESTGNLYDIQYRAGKSTRCQYCGVSSFCSQYQNVISKEETDDGNSAIPTDSNDSTGSSGEPA